MERKPISKAEPSISIKKGVSQLEDKIYFD
jgi:hypothetical protein